MILMFYCLIPLTAQVDIKCHLILSSESLIILILILSVVVWFAKKPKYALFGCYQYFFFVCTSNQPKCRDWWWSCDAWRNPKCSVNNDTTFVLLTHQKKSTQESKIRQAKKRIKKTDVLNLPTGWFCCIVEEFKKFVGVCEHHYWVNKVEKLKHMWAETFFFLRKLLLGIRSIQWS